MRILIPRIPSSMTHKELLRLVKGVLSKNLIMRFRAESVITDVRIVKIKDSRGIVDHFGVVELASDTIGHWFLANFKDQYVHGKRVFARQFIHRGPDHPAFSAENDRRRPQLKVEQVTESNLQIEGDAEFVRVYGEPEFEV